MSQNNIDQGQAAETPTQETKTGAGISQSKSDEVLPHIFLGDFIVLRLAGWKIAVISFSRTCVGNQQKWDTFGKERSGGCGSIVGHPALPVVAFAPL